MWIPKHERDEKRGVDSPIPTQVVSNEEFIPCPQTEDQRKWEFLIGEMAEEKSKKLGMDRRDFMRSSMGMATAFLAANKVYGNYWQVDESQRQSRAHCAGNQSTVRRGRRSGYSGQFAKGDPAGS